MLIFPPLATTTAVPCVKVKLLGPVPVAWQTPLLLIAAPFWNTPLPVKLKLPAFAALLPESVTDPAPVNVFVVAPALRFAGPAAAPVTPTAPWKLALVPAVARTPSAFTLTAAWNVVAPVTL